MNKDQQKRIKAMNALTFLRSHPAVNPDCRGDSLFDGSWLHMAKCCKRGMDESCRKIMTVYRGDKGWENLKHRFDKQYKNDTETPLDLQSIYATYKEVFQEPWVFDHMEYWYEITFFVFQGNPYNYSECQELKNWGAFVGPESGARTFEDMLIDQATEVKKAYGNFDKYKDFILPFEKKNHETNSLFQEKNLTSKKYSLIRNKEYLEITSGMTNLRWLQWYVKTDHYKKTWDKYLDGRVKALDKIPVSRQRLIEKYSKL